MLKATVVILENAEKHEETIEAVSPLFLMARAEMIIRDLPNGVTVNVVVEGKVVLCKAK